MPITLTADEFNEFAKYTKPERLEKFLINHYKNKKFTIEEEILSCIYVANKMVCKLFTIAFPRDGNSMKAFLAKSDANDLLVALIEETESTGLCWGEPTAKDSSRPSVISKVFSKICESSYCLFYSNPPLSNFLNASIVTLPDIKLLIQNQWYENLTTVRAIINCVKAKYLLDELLADFNIKELETLAAMYKYDDIHVGLLEIIKSKKDSALASSSYSTSGGAGSEEDYYSPGEEDEVVVSGALTESETV